MNSEKNLEKELAHNLMVGPAPQLLSNLFEYGIKKFRQKAPEWKEKFKNWINRHFY